MSKTETSQMPQCRVPREGHIEIILPGQAAGTVLALQGLAAEQAESIALNMKDALIAAVINKCRFRIRLVDVKDARGNAIETVMQAEYDRDGMQPVRVWSNIRGEAAALATILRRFMSAHAPDMVSS